LDNNVPSAPLPLFAVPFAPALLRDTSCPAPAALLEVLAFTSFERLVLASLDVLALLALLGVPALLLAPLVVPRLRCAAASAVAIIVAEKIAKAAQVRRACSACIGRSPWSLSALRASLRTIALR
jgi:hypothetical protein